MSPAEPPQIPDEEPAVPAGSAASSEQPIDPWGLPEPIPPVEPMGAVEPVERAPEPAAPPPVAAWPEPLAVAAPESPLPAAPVDWPEPLAIAAPAPVWPAEPATEAFVAAPAMAPTEELLEWPAAENRAPSLWAEAATTRAHVTATGGGLDAVTVPSTSRAVDGRLARVHLRGGLLTLARASLEQMAGVGALDREALADLAEARWRSGDLEGAAEAAIAHLDAGGDEPIAHLIVAEEADRQGSLVEARRHAAVVRERAGAGLDRLFAGEPRSTAWPMEIADWMDDGALAPGRWGLLAGGREVVDPAPGTWRLVSPPAFGSPVARPRNALAVAAATATPSTLDQLALGRAAGQELEAAEQELLLGHIPEAVDRLALVLRFDPALAPVILSMADRALIAPGDRQQGLAAIHLLRGDAYRGLGREVDAAEAYQEAMRALPARATDKESQ